MPSLVDNQMQLFFQINCAVRFLIGLLAFNFPYHSN